VLTTPTPDTKTMAKHTETLLNRCISFVGEQSCGEWDDKTIREDAVKVAAFVRKESVALVRALEEIAYPIRAMQDRLKLDEKLDGIAAVAVANNADYLRAIALHALSLCEQEGGNHG
jgi:hypothetical protein